MIPNLKTVPAGRDWKGSFESATVVGVDGTPAIEFDNPEFNVIWLNGFEFSSGTIEFDAMGKSEPQGSSFVGVAFRVMDELSYDAIYFRPFNFRAVDPDRKSHAVQYISHPLWPWYRLREEYPGQYEQPLDPAPDGDEWFHAKVVVEGRQITVFLNSIPDPVLQVNELGELNGGSVGLWCYGYGRIANLLIVLAE